jgi:SAM-dependent methyltransferase
MDVPLESLEAALIRKELRKRSLLQEPYLEVGCGDGFNLERFSKMGMRGVGLDSSPEAISLLREKKIPGVAVIAEDFLSSSAFPTQPRIIFMLNLLEHVHEDDRFIAKAFSLLPQNGYLVIAVPANQKAYGFADSNAGHIRRYEKQALREKLRNAGFCIDTWMSVGFPINRGYTWLFNILNKKRQSRLDEAQTPLSGIRNKKDYYGGGFDAVAKIAYPILGVLIQLDRLFTRTNLGNNILVFAKKVA